MRFSCVLELDKGKWEIAREAGAGEIIDPNAEGALKSLMKATGGVAAAIDFVGAAATFNFGFQALRKAGKLVCVGLFGGSSQVVPGRWRYARASRWAPGNTQSEPTNWSTTSRAKLTVDTAVRGQCLIPPF